MTARAQDKKVWLAGGAALAVLTVAIGWLAVISPQLSSAKTLRGEAVSARAQNDVLTAKVAKLKKQNESVGALRTTLRIALQALPFDSGLPTFTRQLSAQATRSGVALTSITVGAISGTTTAGTTTSGTTTSGTTTSGTTTAGATTGSASGATPAPTVLSIPVTLLSKGSNAHQLAFLKAIQVIGPRRALVLSTTLGTGSSGSGRSIDKSAVMTTQLTVFTAPLDAAGRAQLTKLLSAK